MSNSVEFLTTGLAEAPSAAEFPDTGWAADRDIAGMDIVVQKYGGTSLGTVELIRQAAGRVASLASSGRQVVVVVSAMGDTTNSLVALAGQVAQEREPDPRELDQVMATGEQVSAALFALALAGYGVDAVSLAGDQAGIVVTGPPGAGLIARIDIARIVERLRRGQVVVVAGFQGRDAGGELLTLGRGGSDTTAVALAAALGSSVCEIYTDVHGVRTADPRVVGDTQPVPAVSYEAMAELARSGAQVLHPRAVELAALRGVPVQVAHSSAQGPGTAVEPAEQLEGQQAVVGIAHEREVQMVRLVGIPAAADRWVWALSQLAEQGLVVDALTGTGALDGCRDLCFAVRGMGVAAMEEVLRAVSEELGGGLVVERDLSVVSLVGVGLLGRPEYLARMLRTLGGAGIPVWAMSTSNSRLTSVLPTEHLGRAVRILHHTFGLHLPADDRPAWLDEPANQPLPAVG